MRIITTNFTVSDYCQDLEAHKLLVNTKYQRSDQVWPPIARSFFIETVLLGFPIPKLSLYQVTDVNTRRTHKEIVDGQQRSQALLDFYQDKLRLSSSLETTAIANKKYSQLDEEYKGRFLTYSLACDLFVGASEADIREVFRRINAYTVPLNPEEQRHAVFQGEMKWFIYRLSRELEATFLQLGVFGSKQIVRMADTKLLADLCFALLHGLKTTKRKQLDTLYKDKDQSFPEEKQLRQRFRLAFTRLFDWEEIHSTPLMRPHMVYSLALAVTHVLKPNALLNQYYAVVKPGQIDEASALSALTTLSELLGREEDDVPKKDRPFYQASSSKTNVDEPRIARFVRLCEALEA